MPLQKTPLIVNITDSQEVILTASFSDAKGNPATVTGVPVWTTSDETIATVAASTDGLSATVVAVAEGQATVSVDADAGVATTGPQSITGTVDVVVGAGVAVTTGITAGSPTEQP